MKSPGLRGNTNNADASADVSLSSNTGYDRHRLSICEIDTVLSDIVLSGMRYHGDMPTN